MVKSVFFSLFHVQSSMILVTQKCIKYTLWNFCCLNLGYFSYLWREINIYIGFFIPLLLCFGIPVFFYWFRRQPGQLVM